MDWQQRAVCRTRPADWWDTGDDGNRLALMLCQRACPVSTQRAATDPTPAGVVRAGVAYSDNGHALQMCPCGYPIVGRTGRVNLCTRCAPVSPRLVLPKPTPSATVSASLLTVGRRVRAELLADGQLAGGRRLTVAIRARGFRLSDASGKALSWQLRQEDAQRGVTRPKLTRKRQPKHPEQQAGQRAA